MALEQKQRMKRARRSETSYTTEEWNGKRELITRLYFEEDKTLKDVRQILERDYNFRPTYAHFCTCPLPDLTYITVSACTRVDYINGD